MYPVLLHPDLYRSLRDTAPAGRERVWKTLARLRDGRWGGGTRVKRLRGIGRPVYEARTDAGDRLLFTMVRSLAMDTADTPGRLLSHLQVWDWVEHDDAVRTARRNRSPEAEFLELEALEEFEIQEPPPFPSAQLDDIPADPAESGAEGVDPLLRFLLPPDGFEPPFLEDTAEGEDLRGGVRWFRLAPGALASEAEFQRLLDAGGEDLELKLTREQYGVLRTPGPVLLAGSAGSGKTTIAVHRLAQAVLAGVAGGSGSGRALYLSYSPALVEHARGLYGDLMRAQTGDAGSALQPDFFTFGDLYRALVPRDFREHQARPMTERLFREWFRKAGRSLDPGLVWEELRSILKGACLSPGQPMLDEAAYYELGRKRAPLFVDERPEIYRIAQRYQEWLAEEGRSDRIDLCRRALQELRPARGQRGSRWSYDTLVCDEVQDLTELEVSFVLSLSAREDLGGVLLTGDTQQIVNPSGFRWAEVRKLAGKQARKQGNLKAAPEVTRLRRNLRSARPVVELANALLLLRREIFGRTEGDEPEEAAIAGPVPLEVPGEEDAVLAALAGFGPRAAVLTFDDAEAERLRQKLGTTRIFHVREAKGLEFDAVLLWKLLEPDRDLVERLIRGDTRLTKEPRFEHLLRHLYVGVTRARRHLAIYEGPQAHPFWSDGRLRGRIEREAVESLAHLFRPTASPEDWAREGDYFFDRGRFRQAAECYRRASLPEREVEAMARAGEALEDWAGALERWGQLGMAERQAPLLERLGRLPEAACLYRETGQEDAAERCELRLLEQRGAWKEAAAAWEARGEAGGGSFAEAARCWARAGEERRALQASAHAAEERGDAGDTDGMVTAAEMWSSLGDYAAAARCYRASGDAAGWTLARARADEAAGRWARAAVSYRRAGHTDAAERCRARAEESAGRLEQAAHTWESLGEVERALDLYARGDRWLDVARLEGPCREKERRLLGKVLELLETGAWEEASPLARRRLEALRPFLPEIPWFVASEEQRLVWQEFCLLSDLENRCRALQAEAEGAWSRAARCWHIAGDHDRAAAAWTRRIAARADRQAARSLRSSAGNAQEADGILRLGSGPRTNPGGTA